jgi:diguanylate cyclase (GGDEF)-like protein
MDDNNEKQSILVVDDESSNLLAINKLFSPENTIYFAKTGADCLRLAEENKPDIILMDVMMPDVNGFDVLLQLKNNPSTMKIPVILVTGLADEEDEERGFTYGAVDYIKKPFKNAIVKVRVNTHLQIARQLKENERLGRIDPLTGLANRRQFNERLELEWKQAIRDQVDIAFIMLDLDYFKQYNDTYGHPQGDELLKQVARVLTQAGRRPGDLPARLGGEEFGVLLPQTDTEAAAIIAEKIRASVEAMQVPLLAGSSITKITCSLGVAGWTPQLGDNMDDLPAKADAALYDAKKSGRNRVCISVT